MRIVSGIRLIATDYDGTLATAGKVSPQLAEELVRVMGPQHMLAIITGRSPGSLLQALSASQLPVEAYPHALVCEERDIYLVHEGELLPLQQHNQAAFACEAALLPSTRKLAELLRQAWPDIVKEQLADAATDMMALKQSTPDVEDVRGYVEMVFAAPTAARVALAFLAGHISAPEITAVRNGRLVSLRHRAYGKGAVLHVLCRHLGLVPEQVMAVGDSGNDLSMLDGRYGFWAAAVGNADAEVIQAVRAHDGVLLRGCASEGIRELLQVCEWQQFDEGRVS